MGLAAERHLARMNIGSAVEYEVITPNDGADLRKPCRGILVGTAGTVQVTTMKDEIVTIPLLAAGMLHAITAKRIWSTGTTAVSILVEYVY